MAGYDPTANDPTAGLDLGDPTADTPSQLNTLFGVDRGVGKAPVILQKNWDPERGRSPGTNQQTTVTEALQGFYGMSSTALANLQQQLYAGGFYADSYYKQKGASKIALGVPDEDSYEAFKRAIMRSARSGSTITDVLDEAASSRAGADAAAAEPITLTNPEHIANVFQSVAKKLTGKRLDDDVVNRFVSVYQGQEAGAQRAPVQPGGAMVGAPAADTAAEGFLRENYGADVRKNSLLGAMANFEQILAGPRPTLPGGG